MKSPRKKEVSSSSEGEKRKKIEEMNSTQTQTQSEKRGQTLVEGDEEGEEGDLQVERDHSSEEERELRMSSSTFPENLLRKSLDSAFSIFVGDEEEDESSEEMSRFLSTGIAVRNRK